jgi:O-antigen ligase
MNWQRLKQYITVERIIAVIVLWQVISVLLAGLGVWPDQVAWLNFALLAGFVLIAKPYHSVLLLVISIPFIIVLPNRFLPDLPAWRPLFALLFVVWAIRLLAAQRDYVRKTLSFRRWYREMSVSETPWYEVIWNALLRVNSRLMPWDKIGALLIVIAFISLMKARFPVHGLKQIIFLINVYLLYLVIINVVTDQEKIRQLIRYTAYSLGLIVLIGYIQFIATFFTDPYYFWQYWATMISRLYYGLPLANILVYSNSWFSYTGSTQSLRMFSIMPDSHSFALIGAFFIAVLVPLLFVFPKRAFTSVKDYLSNPRSYMWTTIRLSGLAVVLSGTRGVWVGMLVPLVVAGWLYIRGMIRPLLKPLLLGYVLIILLFALTPLINQGLSFLRVSGYKEDFLERARSIYDLRESSNAGRLEIWRDSAKFAVLHPFGVGYGNFIVSLVDDIPEGTPYESVGAQENLRYNLPQKFVTAHSLYLNLLVELGFAGVLVFGLFWWEFIGTAWQFIRDRQSESNLYTMFIVSVTFTVLWLLAYSVFDATFLNDRVLTYTFLLLALAGLIMTKYHSFTDTE